VSGLPAGPFAAMLGCTAAAPLVMMAVTYGIALKVGKHSVVDTAWGIGRHRNCRATDPEPVRTDTQTMQGPPCAPSLPARPMSPPLPTEVPGDSMNVAFYLKESLERHIH
jgi:hypothetical protein